jgi:hypothetical protein
MVLGSTQPLVKMSTRNIPGVKGGRCVGLTTSPPLRAECHGIWEPKPPGTLWATPGLFRESFTVHRLLFCTVTNKCTIRWSLCKIETNITRAGNQIHSPSPGDTLTEQEDKTFTVRWLVNMASNSLDQFASKQRASILPALNSSCQQSQHKDFKFVRKKVNYKSIKAFQIPDIPSFSTLSCHSRHITTCILCASPQFLITNLQQNKCTCNTCLRI